MSLNRRRFLGLGAGLAALGVAQACAGPAAPSPVASYAPQIGARERVRRAANANVVNVDLRAKWSTVDLGGVHVLTWTFDDQLPGKEIRVRRGDVLRAKLSNELGQDTSIHWHGIALRNDMDGVPDLTQDPVRPNSTFDYEFAMAEPGTYFFHPHVGAQLDRGLYAPLIIEDPNEAGRYDAEAVIVLDDWLDGVTTNPDAKLAELQRQGMSMGGMDHGGMGHGVMPGMDTTGSESPLGSDTGDVQYPHYLLNGRIPTAPTTIAAKPGQRLRLRIINAAADTPFRVALGGHRMTITDTDGFPVQPMETDSLLIGMGERFDVVVTLSDGVFPLVASAEGKQGQAMGLVRTGGGAVPGPEVRPRELDGQIAMANALSAAEPVRFAPKRPDRTHTLELGMDMSVPYRWTINGQTFDEHTPLPIAQGERVRLRFVNKTMMFHPMHLHGHTFQLVSGQRTGARKDTTIVLPMQTVEADFEADNPGQWLVHCHNIYHGESGMMTTLSYLA
ncbi:multicopper oxidase domain-containing protein [Allosaccharopolyspora coralli]|uniref:Multicopper oxidase domain-containing protein n=2 Tax=Allosaccharopolyspora coralli TaxID=2665642 RepID=A0A5Q3QE73_9PSEU|nr:multicopper oxidase domain-containing protein [Allosaccharopolyspora coralli]